MKILLAGDLHGNTAHIRNVFARACRVEADIIFQVGDFGWGWRVKDRKDAFTSQVSDLVQETGIQCYWLPGNHENYDTLNSVLDRLQPKTDGTFEVDDGVFYVPRGTVLMFDGIRFLCCGGATSVDRQYRKPGESWWPEEAITEDDVEKCAAAGKADVLLSHDFPWECNIVDRHLSPYWGEVAQADTIASRKKISWIAREAEVDHIFHGHLHISYQEDVQIGDKTVHVTGLDCDGKSLQLSTLLIDTEDIK